MKILVIPDTHFPDTCWHRLAQVRDFARWYKPDRIVHLGDVIDAKAWGRWPKDPDDRAPADEWEAVVEAMDKFHTMFAKYPVDLLFGNHDIRPVIRALEVGLPKALVRSLDQIFQYDNFRWHPGPKPLVIDNIVFAHGDEMGGTPAQKASRLGKCYVQGHTHRASLTFITTFQHAIWAMEGGCIINPEAKAFRYAARNPSISTQAFSTITDGWPVIYPLSA